MTHMQWARTAFLSVGMMIGQPNNATRTNVHTSAVDAVDYLLQHTGTTMLLAQVEQLLGAAFDDVNTAMGWSAHVDNWTPLRWRCGVDAATGRLQGCLWLFAGSSEHITNSGQWHVWAHVARCAIPLRGDVLVTLGTLAAHRPIESLLQAKLPESRLSLETILLECLENAAADPLPRIDRL